MDLYRQAFPTLVSAVSVRDDGWAQRGGIDRVLTLACGRTYTVDEKVRTNDWPDILLEEWSDEARRSPGWVLKPLALRLHCLCLCPQPALLPSARGAIAARMAASRRRLDAELRLPPRTQSRLHDRLRPSPHSRADARDHEGNGRAGALTDKLKHRVTARRASRYIPAAATSGSDWSDDVHEDLSELAQRLGRFMAERCTDGLPGHFDDDLLEAFPDENRRSLGVALAELEAEGLVTLSHVMGPYLPRARTTVDLFVACDPGVTGHDPVEDSVILARMLITDPELGGRASDLEKAAGWERRRFNPAFALIIPNIADGRVRKVIQNEYPSLGVLLADEDVVQLRHYVKRHSE